MARDDTANQDGPPDVPLEYAAGSSIITTRSILKQQQLAGTYRINANGLRVRAWKPSASVHRRMQRFIFDRDGNACVLCGSRRDLHLDHIIPYVRGGMFIEGNIQTLCGSCNSRKGGRTDALVQD
jgi:hypothetical protein